MVCEIGTLKPSDHSNYMAIWLGDILFGCRGRTKEKENPLVTIIG
jgi:hypothetical protein